MRTRFMLPFAFVVSALCGGAAETQREDLYRMARAFEVQPMAEEPDWAKPKEPALFSFVWLSDFHLAAGKRMALIEEACRYVCETIEPDFVVITGDNSAYLPKPRNQNEASKPKGRRRQEAFRRFLNKNLTVPYVVIPGDNWPWRFEEVFGAFQFSFDVGGVHFLFTSLDRTATGTEGCAVFDPATWEWMQADLQRNARKPTLVFMHESMLPPTYLDAGRFLALLESQPQVVATLCGHMHMDLEFSRRHIRHLVCPSLGLGAANGMKHVSVFRDRIVLTTHELNAKSGTFQQVKKWQKIALPKGLRGSLTPLTGTFHKANYSEVPPHARRVDQTLKNRRMELARPLLMFLLEMGMKGLVSGAAAP